MLIQINAKLNANQSLRCRANNGFSKGELSIILKRREANSWRRNQRIISPPRHSPPLLRYVQETEESRWGYPAVPSDIDIDILTHPNPNPVLRSGQK
jgi:hypothetical protein